MNLRVGKISQLIFSSYSFCSKCSTTWNLVKEVNVMHSKDRGVFTLCEKCWNKSSVDTRVKHHKNRFSDRFNKEEMTSLVGTIAEMSKNNAKYTNNWR